jgi:hypothetical protein
MKNAKALLSPDPVARAAGFFFAKISRFQFRQHAEVNYPVMGNAVPNPGFRSF